MGRPRLDSGQQEGEEEVVKLMAPSAGPGTLPEYEESTASAASPRWPHGEASAAPDPEKEGR